MLLKKAPTYVCSECGFDLWIPLETLDVSTLGLYDDARFPGRCLLALHDHYEDLSDLQPRLLDRFMADLQRAGRAIRQATDADRMNYAVLGNVVPHVHFHIVPRVLSRDPVPNRPPWEHPDPITTLPPQDRERVAIAIAKLVRL